MVNPITPAEAKKLQASLIPEEVIAVVNELIAKNYAHGYSRVLQKDIVEKLISDLGCERKEIFEKGWLEIESAYEEHGWKVTYDRPAYNESYEASFTFKAK
jgi:hypothetical protein